MRFDARSVEYVCLALIGASAFAQTTDRVPLKNWSAPNYWQSRLPAETLPAADAGAIASRAPQPDLSTPGTGTVSVFVAITPCRLVDTRSNMPTPYGAGSSTPLVWGPSSQHSVPATGLASGSYTTPNPCVALPAAQAYSANITVWPQSPTTTSNKWLSVCPTGTSTATCSATAALTWYESGTAGTAAAIVANASVIPANGSGSFDVYVTDNSWVIIDINGYYTSPNTLALGAGTAAAPALTFSNDSTSGLYSSSAGTVNVAAGGTNKLTVTSTGVGIGTGTPGSALDVAGNINFTGNVLYQGTTVLQVPGGASALSVGVGVSALAGNTSGVNNAAVGANALVQNTSGCCNAAVGRAALSSNTTGNFNVAVGGLSLQSNTIGVSNTAVGHSALNNNLSGSNNIAVGESAGNGLTNTASNNIDIGNNGASTDSGVIRIGTTNTQSAFYVAGVNGVTTTNSAVPVLIDTTNGQLGVTSSSRRYKEDIEDMGDSSSNLMRLRPVTFRYKKPFADGSKPIQYGLVAEEVEEVYPDLVAHSADGQIETVKYQVLDSMLLNEVQKQRRTIEAQSEALKTQEDLLKSQTEAIRRLESRLAELEQREK